TPVDLLWVGSSGGMEQALVAREGIAFRGVETGKLRGANPVKAAQTLGALAAGVRQSQALIAEWRPDVCFVTGGYVCAPVVMACALRKVPICIYLPDMTPGWTIHWMSRVAQRVCVSFAEVAPHFGGEVPTGKAVVTGYPVRADLVQWAQDRSAARRHLAAALKLPLNDTLPVVLVWGGSQGSRIINTSTWGALAQVTPLAHVLHVVGTRDWPLWQEREPALRAELGPTLFARYHPVDYLHDEMAPALAAASLSVARAGASTLGEFPVAHLPSILAPLVGVNQQANAELLAQRGGAVILSDEVLAEYLAPTLTELLTDAPRRSRMEEALTSLARPHAALAIAQQVVALGRRAAAVSTPLAQGALA
ncbi:MAG: UDP-N-acetylglucosamine--N-acetylmuramyl-(pentapeptide) pyrophosphoryl-undecaprenol N-acetylglucosamine transferase, partial [Caldilineaceae bacterium]